MFYVKFGYNDLMVLNLYHNLANRALDTSNKDLKPSPPSSWKDIDSAMNNSACSYLPRCCSRKTLQKYYASVLVYCLVDQGLTIDELACFEEHS